MGEEAGDKAPILPNANQHLIAENMFKDYSFHHSGYAVSRSASTFVEIYLFTWHSGFGSQYTSKGRIIMQIINNAVTNVNYGMISTSYHHKSNTITYHHGKEK